MAEAKKSKCYEECRTSCLKSGILRSELCRSVPTIFSTEMMVIIVRSWRTLSNNPSSRCERSIQPIIGGFGVGSVIGVAGVIISDDVHP